MEIRSSDMLRVLRTIDKYPQLSYPQRAKKAHVSRSWLEVILARCETKMLITREKTLGTTPDTLTLTTQGKNFRQICEVVKVVCAGR